MCNDDDKLQKFDICHEAKLIKQGQNNGRKIFSSGNSSLHVSCLGKQLFFIILFSFSYQNYGFTDISDRLRNQRPANLAYSVSNVNY